MLLLYWDFFFLSIEPDGLVLNCSKVGFGLRTESPYLLHASESPSHILLVTVSTCLRS